MNSIFLCALLCTACLLGFSGAARAADTFVPCRPGAKVFYVNGVNKTNEQVVAYSAAKLARNVAHFGVTCVADVSHLFNPSDGLFADLLGEVATQKAAELKVSFADALLQVGLAALGYVSTLSEADQTAIRERLTAFVQAVSLSSYTFTINGVVYTPADLVNHFRDRVLVELGQGTRTVLVAHSQGNLFANETYLAVKGATSASVSQGLAVVNVANAASTAPSGLCLTSDHDFVIMPLIVAEVAMDCSTDGSGSNSVDLSGHGFDEVYQSRTLPTGASEAGSLAGQLMARLQEALGTPSPVGTIYGSTSYGLFSVNLATRTVTTPGSFSYTDGTSVPVWDIAVNPRGGLIYAISPNAISTFSIPALSLTRLPQATVGGNALTFSADGELYGMGGNKIYHFDTSSGAATQLPISLGGYTSSGDLAFDSDGNLFGTAIGPGGGDYLLRIDLINRMTVTVVGPTGFSALYGLYFSSGYLYGITTTGTLITIDPLTGIGQPDGQLPIGDITGLQ